MLRKHAFSAKKALSLRRDVVFRLLVVMTALLGWVSGVGTAGIFGLENVYDKWQLEQQRHISVYLMAGAAEEKVSVLVKDLQTVPGVQQVTRLSEQETFTYLQPYFDKESYLPLPVTLELAVDHEIDRVHLAGKVKRHFPDAEVDDARQVLSQVGHGVRFIQLAVLIIAMIALAVMILLVSMTVRAGLQGKRRSLSIMKYIGATDSFLTDLVTRQVVSQSLVGWCMAALLGVLSVYAARHLWLSTVDYITPAVWASTVIVPFVLVLISMAAAWMTARQVVRK